MDGAQVWGALGGLGAFLGTLLALVYFVLTRSFDGMRSEMSAGFAGLRGEMEARFDGVAGLRGEMDVRFDGLRGELNARFDGLRGEMNARFDTVDHRLETLDRDVQALTNRVFGEGA